MLAEKIRKLIFNLLNKMTINALEIVNKIEIIKKL